MLRDLRSAYFFDLRMVCGGFAYYVTHTVFIDFTKAGRELRKSDPVNVKVFSQSAKLFRQKVSIIHSVEEYNDWLYLRGWAIVEPNMAKSNMRVHLRQLKSPYQQLYKHSKANTTNTSTSIDQFWNRTFRISSRS